MKMPGLRSALARFSIRRQNIELKDSNMVKMTRDRLSCRQAAHARANDDGMLSYQI
jgi:hypothetical protein